MILIVSLLDSGVITATNIFNYETDPTKFLLIVDTGGTMRSVLTINIIDAPEPPDCTADPLFSSGSGMTLTFSYYLVSIEATVKEMRHPFCLIWKYLITLLDNVVDTRIQKHMSTYMYIRKHTNAQKE